jgi:hypothetical protein
MTTESELETVKSPLNDDDDDDDDEFQPTKMEHSEYYVCDEYNIQRHGAAIGQFIDFLKAQKIDVHAADPHQQTPCGYTAVEGDFKSFIEALPSYGYKDGDRIDIRFVSAIESSKVMFMVLFEIHHKNDTSDDDVANNDKEEKEEVEKEEEEEQSNDDNNQRQKENTNNGEGGDDFDTHEDEQPSKHQKQ